MSSLESFFQVNLHQNALATQISHDKGKIAIGVFYGEGNVACGGDLIMMNPDGTDPVTVPHSGNCGSLPSFSPDGKRLAFDAPDYDFKLGVKGASRIIAVNIDGSNHTVLSLTNKTVFDMSPSFSPDGSKIVFSGLRDGSRYWHIYVMNANGTGGLLRLTNNNTNDGSPVFSPDGKKIAFTRDGEIYSMNSDNGSDQTNLTNNSVAKDLAPSFSPDGTRIAFASDRDGDNNWNIYTMNAKDGANPTRLTTNPAKDTAPTWSPDGTRIAFSSWRDGGSNSEIYVMNADGSKQTRITDFNNAPIDAASYGSPSWGPAVQLLSGVTSSTDKVPPALSIVFPQDGSRFYFSTSSSESDIHMRGTASDFGSGIEKVEVRVDSDAFQKANGNLAWEYTISPSSILRSEGIHNITIKATDVAGNTSTNTIAISANILRSTSSMHTTLARSIVVADSSSCLALSIHDSAGSQKTAHWEPNTRTCSITHGTVTIKSSSSLAIPPSVTLKIAKSVVLQNNGTIKNSGTIENDGKLNNSGIMISSGVIKNHGTLTNSGTLSNSNILDNFGIVDNSGRLINSGYVHTCHRVNSDGIIVGVGSILNSGYMDKSD
jgi:Tol biopolymer transport system component